MISIEQTQTTLIISIRKALDKVHLLLTKEHNNTEIGIYIPQAGKRYL